VVVVNNRSYAVLEGFAARLGIGKPVGTSLPGIDFVSLAQGQGVPASRVERAGELEDALRAALSEPGPNLLEVRVA
jgi:benzoylformate decarboxylase